MLDARIGGLRPWEMELLTPAEELSITKRKQQLDAQLDAQQIDAQEG